MTKRLAVALHLVLAAFAERQIEQAALCPGTHEAHGERDRGAVVERQSSPPSVEIGPAHVAGHLGLVQPRQAIAGMEQSMGQRTVVGEHEQPFDVHVEAADGKEARVGPHQVRYHRPAIGIAARGQIPAGLVKEDVLLRLRGRQATAVDGDVVAVGVGDGPRLADDVAVDGDTSLEDEAISSPP